MNYSAGYYNYNYVKHETFFPKIFLKRPNTTTIKRTSNQGPILEHVYKTENFL